MAGGEHREATSNAASPAGSQDQTAGTKTVREDSATSSSPGAIRAQTSAPQGVANGSPPTTSTTGAAHPATAGSATQAVSSDATTQLPTIFGSSPQTSATPAGSPANLASGSGVAMQEMIDSIRATIEVAARQGATHAHIELQPEGLGNLSIRLSQSDDGLRARVTADTPAAAQALTEGRSELRQSLSSLGLSLLQLDIGSYGESQARERGDRFAGASQETVTSKASAANEDAQGIETVGALDGANQPGGIARGELVDVLA